MNASDIRESSARLNATTYPTQNVAQYGRFLWGSTANLGNSTPRVALGTGATLLLSQSIVGLNPGTTYYYRPIVDNQLGTVEGALSSFTTTGNAPASAGAGGWTSDDSAYVAYNSAPVRGKVVSTTNPTHSTASSASVSASSQKTTPGNEISAGNDSVKESGSVAAAAFSGSHSIFPRTLGDWFTIIFLLFIFVLTYITWKFYLQKKEDELEYATVPEILTNVVLSDTASQTPPVFQPRKYVKDPFYGNNKTETATAGFAGIAMAKSAPPENLPV
jgi:hypothetical protein